MGGILISSNNFLVLFIRVLQSKMTLDSNVNLFMANWSFSREELERFIFISKSDYRYVELLRGFNFQSKHSIDFSIAINHAKNKRLITVEVDGICYIARSYIPSVDSDVNFYDLMLMFVDDFMFFVQEPDNYINVIGNYQEGESLQRLERDLNIQALIREIHHRSIVEYQE